MALAYGCGRCVIGADCEPDACAKAGAGSEFDAEAEPDVEANADVEGPDGPPERLESANPAGRCTCTCVCGWLGAVK